MNWLMIALFIIFLVLSALATSALIPAAAGSATDLVQWVQGLFETVWGNGLSNDRGINSAAQLIILAVFVGWCAGRIKKWNRNRDRR
jgi:hypothetical protein